jgi:hypothetical protein
VLGRNVVVTWAGVGISKENRDGLPWPLGRIDGLNRRACTIFKFISRILIQIKEF